jgi:choline dehydrogenase-like flavoprotein
MIYIRGNTADFDGWADEGAPGWSYRQMLPYFIKSECNERGDPRYHDTRGPWRGRTADPCIRSWITCSRRVRDRAIAPTTISTGRPRISTLPPNGRTCESSRNPGPAGAAAGAPATGVSVHRHGQEESLFAQREIILAADDLTRFGIPAVVDLPVGANL